MKGIDADRVDELMKRALDQKAETFQGFVHSYGVNTERLRPHRAEIVGMLEQLPEEFFDDGGQGWTALNLCQTKDGELWTGLHVRTEQLFLMACALGLGQHLLPRDLWPALPFGMPYVVVFRSKFASGAA